MSKKRNQVQFNKPEDPNFLKLFKQQAGYRDDGPSVDTKRAKYDSGEDSDYSDKDEELPQVVVVRSGDLTAEEAEREKQRLELENNTKPADLTERIVFKAKSKKSDAHPENRADTKPSATVAEQQQLLASDSRSSSSTSSKASKSSQKKRAKDTKSKLSFAFEDNDDDDAEE